MWLQFSIFIAIGTTGVTNKEEKSGFILQHQWLIDLSRGLFDE